MFVNRLLNIVKGFKFKETNGLMNIYNNIKLVLPMMYHIMIAKL